MATTPEFEFTFDDDLLDFEAIEADRKKKNMGDRDNVAILKQWLDAFISTDRNVAGKFTWLTLPAPITEAFKPGVTKTGDRKTGGMAAIVRKIKEVQDTLDVYPVPMSDDAIHALNEEHGDDVMAEDPRYGGFILVRKAAWTSRNKKAAAEAAEKDAAEQDAAADNDES